MNKAIIGIIVAVLVVVGVIFFVNRDDAGEPTTENTSESSSNNGSEQPVSIREALDKYEDQECVYSDEFGSGTVFIGDGEMRSDTVSVSAGQTINSHMIADGEFVYAWQDGENQGFKMALSAMSDITADQGVDINKEQEFDCEDWRRDSSKFDLPSSVTFTDYTNFSETMQNETNVDIPGVGGQNPQEDLLNQQCAVCATLPDAATQEQCRVTLSCP